MICKDLKVVNLSITEDNYEYKALFRLCSDSSCMDLDMSMLSEDAIIAEIKAAFGLEEGNDEIRKILNDKIMEASNLESRVKEGQDYDKQVDDKKLQRKIDSLNLS